MAKSRGILIAGNWKMNLGPQETEAFFSSLINLSLPSSLQAWVIPPALSLTTALAAAKKAPFPVSIGAQNVHWEKKGAFTGEISGPMVKEIGVSIALTGHSERRQYFGETDETVRKRSESLLEQGFRVILCIGETRAEREAGNTEEVLRRQLQGAIPEPSKGCAAFLDGRLILAYEPVWAIGTGLTATPEQAEEAHAFIRSYLHSRFGLQASAQTPLLYGGSVTPENAQTLLCCPNVDGALVGGASLKAESFMALLRAGKELI